MSTALKIVEPQDPAASLRSERASISADLEAVNQKIAKCAKIEGEQQAILAEIDALDRRFSDELRAWIGGNCESERPQPRDKEKSKLTAKLASAAEAARASAGARGDLESEALPLRNRLVQVDSEIRAQKILALENEFANRISEFAALASKMQVALLEIRALPLALIQIGRMAFDRNDESHARVCYSAASRMREQTLPEVEPTEVEILGAAARLADKIISGREVSLDTFIAPPAPVTPFERDQAIVAAAARNQAKNVLQSVDPGS